MSSTSFHTLFSLSRSCHSFHSQAIDHHLYPDESYNYVFSSHHVLTYRPKHPLLIQHLRIDGSWGSLTQLNCVQNESHHLPSKPDPLPWVSCLHEWLGYSLSCLSQKTEEHPQHSLFHTKHLLNHIT